jgi:hypothetical protein
MLTKTTQLEAINTMLSAIGEPPVNSLSSQRADSLIAVQILNEVSREVQSYGWHFNIEYKVVMTPDSSGFIYLSENVARVDTDPTEGLDIIVRGNRIYNKATNSYVFSSAITVTQIVMLEFEEIPEPARRYIMIRAARIFMDRMVGSEKHHMFNLQDEVMALGKMREYEMDTADYSIFDEYSTASIIMRNASYRTY